MTLAYRDRHVKRYNYNPVVRVSDIQHGIDDKGLYYASMITTVRLI